MTTTHLKSLTTSIFAIPALLFLYIGSSWAENQVSIVSPQDRDTVKSYVIVTGTVQITDDSFVWVLAHRKDLKKQWWPQDKPKVSDGQWKAVVNIGAEIDIGKDFEIAVATFGEEVKKTIDEYFEIGKDFNRFLPIPFPNATSNVGCPKM